MNGSGKGGMWPRLLFVRSFRRSDGVPEGIYGRSIYKRVVELSRVLAAPLAAQNLADVGADVVKVERPEKGDDSRTFGPPWIMECRETM